MLSEKGRLRDEDACPNVEYLEFYIEAFHELGTCRNSGMGLAPIPFLAILEYARLYDIEGESLDDLLHIVRAMDSALMEHESKKGSNKNAKAN